MPAYSLVLDTFINYDITQFTDYSKYCNRQIFRVSSLVFFEGKNWKIIETYILIVKEISKKIIETKPRIFDKCRFKKNLWNVAYCLYKSITIRHNNKFTLIYNFIHILYLHKDLIKVYPIAFIFSGIRQSSHSFAAAHIRSPHFTLVTYRYICILVITIQVYSP